MKFMVIVKASKDTEAGVMPSTELLAAMGAFNEEMAKAGVIKAGEGLHRPRAAPASNMPEAARLRPARGRSRYQATSSAASG